MNTLHYEHEDSIPRRLYLVSLFLLGAMSAFCVLMFSSPAHAEECGDIIYPDPEIEIRVPIIDCANPFGILELNENLEVYGGEEIAQGGIYDWGGAVVRFSYANLFPDTYTTDAVIYRHVGEDYEWHWLENDEYYFDEPGTYTIVVSEFEGIFPEGGIPATPPSRLIKSLEADYPPNGPTYAVTFRVIPQIESEISNILFLPGIQASRLYTKSEGDEERLWEPGGNEDVGMLSMTEAGESKVPIYTKDVIDELGGIALGTNIYKGFLEFLQNGLGDDHPLVNAFAYDWRYDVFDIVENGTEYNSGIRKWPTDEVEYLAARSSTGKVTIIAHSNGGLLAKALMLKLEEEGKEDLVDKVIFIATPHIGTPKGILALLHGLDQDHFMGYLSDEVARDAMNNMPGVYGLLPSSAYIESLTEPIISFGDGEVTEQYRNAYGFTINSVEEYKRFLTGEEGRIDPGEEIHEPSIGNAVMVDQALRNHGEMLDTWTPPDGVEVFNIVGTGFETPKSVEYQEFPEQKCNEFGQCTIEKILEPVVRFTWYGDETVISKSAGYMDVSKTFFLDIFSEGLGLGNLTYTHGEITESPSVQELVKRVLSTSPTDQIEFISENEPTFDISKKVLQVHSPARIHIVDLEGRRTGRMEETGEWFSEIPGSRYLEVGEVKYLIVPDGSEYTVTIEGEGEGIFTHTIDSKLGDVETSLHRFTATVTPELVATYTKTAEGFSPVSIDSNGDGVVDLEIDLDGGSVEPKTTYEDLEVSLLSLSLITLRENLVLKLESRAEEYFVMRGAEQHIPEAEQEEERILGVLRDTLLRYKDGGHIPSKELERTLVIIDQLIKQ